jgi:hypothetical protein
MLVWEPRLSGEHIEFVIVEDDLAHRFEGRVSGTAMRGVVKSGVGTAETETEFRAARLGGG